ncbi:hypothetical protein Tco_1318208 [Tanacetum coccineum]
MSTYLKNMAGNKHTRLKNKSFKEIQMLFEKEMKRVNIFVDMDAKLVKGEETREESGSKRAGDELEQESSKRKKDRGGKSCPYGNSWALFEQVVTTSGNAKALWDHLKDLSHDNKDTRAINLDNELRSIKIRKMSINDYCTKIKSMADRLKNLG